MAERDSSRVKLDFFGFSAFPKVVPIIHVGPEESGRQGQDGGDELPSTGKELCQRLYLFPRLGSHIIGVFVSWHLNNEIKDVAAL